MEIINGKEFENEVLKSKEKVLVDFYADWCGPCKMLGPIMDELSNDHEIYKVNVDNSSELAQKYGIMSIPTLLIFDKGELVNKSVGFMSKEQVEELLK